MAESAAAAASASAAASDSAPTSNQPNATATTAAADPTPLSLSRSQFFPLSDRPLFNLVESQLSSAISHRPLLAGREQQFLACYVREAATIHQARPRKLLSQPIKIKNSKLTAYDTDKIARVYDLKPRPPQRAERRFLRPTDAAAVRTAEMKLEREEKLKSKKFNENFKENKTNHSEIADQQAETAAETPFLQRFYQTQPTTTAAVVNKSQANQSSLDKSNSMKFEESKSSAFDSSPSPSASQFSKYFGLSSISTNSESPRANKPKQRTAAAKSTAPLTSNLDRPASASLSNYPFQSNRKVAYLLPAPKPRIEAKREPADEENPVSPSESNVTRWLIQKRRQQLQAEILHSSTEHRNRLHTHRLKSASLDRARQAFRHDLSDRLEKTCWSPWMKLQSDLKMQNQRRKMHWEIQQRENQNSNAIHAKQYQQNQYQNHNQQQKQGIYYQNNQNQNYHQQDYDNSVAHSPFHPHSHHLMTNHQELELIQSEEEERIRDVERIESELIIWRDEEMRNQLELESANEAANGIAIDLPRINIPESFIKAIQPSRNRLSVTETLIRQQLEAGQIHQLGSDEQKYNVAYSLSSDASSSHFHHFSSQFAKSQNLLETLGIQKSDLVSGLKSKRFNKPALPKQKFDAADAKNYQNQRNRETDFEPWIGRAKTAIQTKEFEEIEMRQQQFRQMTGENEADNEAARQKQKQKLPARTITSAEIERMEQSFISSILD